MKRLYTYDYLARPVKLVPLTASAMPHISHDGKTYTITLKKGIYFADDPAFGGKKRELTADDYIYSFKRLRDPRVRSAWSWLLEGKIAGLDDVAAKAAKTGRFDYAHPVAGLERVDRYTFRIHLNRPDYNLLHILAHFPTGAVAREVVEKYSGDSAQIMANPVGTGPYRLTQCSEVRKLFWMPIRITGDLSGNSRLLPIRMTGKSSRICKANECRRSVVW